MKAMIMKLFFSSRCVLLVFIVTLCRFNSGAQPFNGFMSFDGIDDELTAAGYHIPTNSDFTIEFWVKTCMDTAFLPQVIVGSSDRLEINFFSLSGDGLNTYELCLRDVNNSHVCHQDQQYYYDGLWHHIAVTYYKASDLFNIFYDGIDGGLSTNYTYNFYPFPNLTVGVGTYQPAFQKHFKGYLDELRVSNTVRYSGAFTPPSAPFTSDASTIRLWHFDETNPLTSVIDDSGNGYNLTPSGNPKTIHLNNLIVQSGAVLTTSETFESYQWIDCTTGIAIPGETGQEYTPTANGDYAVQLTDSSCVLTTGCYSISNVGLQLYHDPEINVYPNPTSDLLYFSSVKGKEMFIELLDLNGKVMYTKTMTQSLSSIDVSELKEGIYFLKVYTSEGLIVKKIIKL